jgi:hypothetical protein
LPPQAGNKTSSKLNTIKTKNQRFLNIFVSFLTWISYFAPNVQFPYFIFIGKLIST